MKAQPSRSDVRPVACSGALALLCVLLAVPAIAQTLPPGGIAPPSRPERPYRGLFGGGVGNTAQSLTLEGSLGGGVADNPIAEQTAAAGPSKGGATGNGSATLTYSMSRTRFGVNADNLFHFDYYSQVEQYRMQPRLVTTTAAWYQPRESTRLLLTYTFKNLPEFSYSDLFESELGQGVPVNQDFGMTLDRYTRHGVSLDVTQMLSKRSRLELSGGFARGMLPTRSWIIMNFEGEFSYNVTKGIALNVGYMDGVKRDTPSILPPERHPRMNFGVDFNRALSFSRRTKLGFTTGVEGTEDRSDGNTTYHLIGSAKLEREFGQTWLAELSYSRDVQHVETLLEPVFADSASFGVQGSFSRRIQFQSRVGEAIARVGSTGDRLETYYGTVQLSIALNKLLAIGADYANYRYKQDQDGLPDELAALRDNQSVRMYLQLWVPLFTKRKSD